ncbi:MAG: cysteine desulfurase family protein [Acidobacteriota bacterium]
MSGRSIYLDYHATTPVDPRVLQAMLPYFTEVFGNPASASHAFGWKAQEAVETARRQVATLIGATAREIVFTSGATESNAWAIRGVTERPDASRRRVVTSAIEHKSVLEAYGRLAEQGWDVVIVPVDRGGRVRLDELERAVTPETALISVMAANNEIGAVQPLADIGRIARANGAVFHVDGAQAVGKVPIDVNAMNIDLLSLTGHKLYGPKGCGALFVRKRTELIPLITGGGQERGMRAGTLNVPGIVGLGCACEICRTDMTEENARLSRLRDRLLKGLTDGVDGVVVNGTLAHRLPHNLHVSFERVEGEKVLMGIGNIAVSSGSACQSASGKPSHVLAAIWGEDAVPSASFRFGIGRTTTEDDIDYVIETFTTVVRKMRELSPVH